MTLLVDVSITAGNADTSQYWYIGHPIRGRIGVAAIAPPELWTTYGADQVVSMTVQRTSSRNIGPFVEYNAGTATVVLVDFDGSLDPVNLPQPPAGAAIRIRWVWDGVTYPVFRGTVQSWIPELQTSEHSTVTVQAADAFEDLAATKPALLGAPVGVGDDTGARIARILDAVSWSADDRDIAVGDSTLQGTLLDGSALQLAQAAVRSEAGELYVDADGEVVFRNRQALLTSARSNTSQATFGTGPGEISYVGSPGLSYDKNQLINAVEATIIGGTMQTASDAVSVARYRQKLHPETDLQLQTDAEALNWALYVLGQDKNPELRFTSLELDARVDPNVLYPQMLGRLLGDRVTVVRRWPGVVDSREVLIRSIEHTWQHPAQWTTTWGLQPVTTYSFWTIGHPTLGRIGSNAIAF